MEDPMKFTAEEARVLGSLAEKQLATPQYYPLTLNALVNACNQSNNRDPIVSYDADLVESTIGSLREKGGARVVHPGAGSRTTKYRQVLDELLGLDARELALACVLLLRGPQTLNELRSRTERLADFDDTAAVERDLDRLAERDPALVIKLERQPGQKEQRYATTLIDLPAAGGAGASSTGASMSRGSGSGGAGLRPMRPEWPSTPRIEPLRDDELNDQHRELLTQVLSPEWNIFRTLLRHTGLFRRWLPFGGKLLQKSSLSPRHREMVILRTAYLCGATYEWAHHVPIGREAGLTDEEIDRIARVASSDDIEWTDDERAVLRACDDLHEYGIVRDATWAALVKAFDGDERRLVEVPMLSGHYRMVAGVLGSLGVQPEEGLSPLPPVR
jgi:uncharacterized protein YceH (UPF0502 family)/alkylhydroperoxidase family enzyme